jgi:hypothetical protein
VIVMLLIPARRLDINESHAFSYRGPGLFAAISVLVYVLIGLLGFDPSEPGN